MAIVSRLGVVLGLDSAQFNQGLGLAQSKLGGFASSTVASRLGVAALGASLVGAAVNAIQYADSINDTAKANDVAVGTVLKLSEALSVSGGNSENTGKLFSSLTNKIDEAANGSDKGRESFEKLGISVVEILSIDDSVRKAGNDTVKFNGFPLTSVSSLCEAKLKSTSALSTNDDDVVTSIVKNSSPLSNLVPFKLSQDILNSPLTALNKRLPDEVDTLSIVINSAG